MFGTFNLINRISANHLAIIAVLVFVSSVLFIYIAPNRSAWEFAFGAAIGVAGLMFNNAVTLHSNAVNHTRDYMHSGDTSVAQAYRRSMDFLYTNRPFNRAKAKFLFNAPEKEYQDIARDIKFTLNHLEEMALFINAKILDEYLLYEYQKDAYIEYFGLVSPALDYLRNQDAERDHPVISGKTDDLYCHFEEMIIRWRRRNDRPERNWGRTLLELFRRK